MNLDANSYDESVQASADSAAHEFMEAVTDPHLDAWYDENGFEVADKCEYDYQGVVHLANRSTWQIQSEWSNALAACEPWLRGRRAIDSLHALGPFGFLRLAIGGRSACSGRAIRPVSARA